MGHHRRSLGWSALGLLVAIGSGTYVSACVGDEPTVTGGDQDGGGNDGIAPGAIACKTTSDCTSGSCIDGFCCNATCDGQCEACDVSGHEGTCTPVAGKPHHEACSGDSSGACAGACDGTKIDACTFPTTSCGTPGACAGGVAQLPQTCNNGACGASSMHTCSLGCFQDGCLGVAQVAASRTTTCALLTDSSVRCWGANGQGAVGQMPTGASQIIKVPTEVSTFAVPAAKMVGASDSSMCAVLNDGTVKCWGTNAYGEMGNATNFGSMTIFQYDPSAVDGVSGATFISTGSGIRFCAIVAGGGVKCWGYNSNGSLGYGVSASTTPSTYVTQDVCAPGSTTTPCTKMTGATYVAQGDNTTCAIIAGKVACWGSNSYGQLGFAKDNGDHPFPAYVAGITDAVTVTSGNSVVCAATKSGKGYCWGGNGGGWLGIGSPTASVTVPTEVCTAADCSTHPTGVTQITTYDDVSCALVGGGVKCWGENGNGQLGDGTTTSARNFLGSSSIASGATQIATGGETNFAIVVDGPEQKLKCWGDDYGWGCGDGPDGGGATQKVPIEPKWQ